MNLLYLYCFFWTSFLLGARMSSWQLSSAGTRWRGPSPRWGRGRCRGPQQAGNTRHSHRNSQSPSLSDLSVPSLLFSSWLFRLEEKTLTDIKSNLRVWGRLILTAGASCRASLLMTRQPNFYSNSWHKYIDSPLMFCSSRSCRQRTLALQIRNKKTLHLASNFLLNPYPIHLTKETFSPRSVDKHLTFLSLLNVKVISIVVVTFVLWY